MGTGDMGMGKPPAKMVKSGRIGNAKSAPVKGKKATAGKNTTGGKGTSVVTNPRVKATGTKAVSRTNSKASGVPVNKGTSKAK